MRIALLLFIVIAVVVVIALRARGAASSDHRNRPVDQPDPIDADHQRHPPGAGEDPGPVNRSGDPVPGSQEDRERHGKP